VQIKLIKGPGKEIKANVPRMEERFKDQQPMSSMTLMKNDTVEDVHSLKRGGGSADSFKLLEGSPPGSGHHNFGNVVKNIVAVGSELDQGSEDDNPHRAHSFNLNDGL
jgi:hypothetical protein